MNTLARPVSALAWDLRGAMALGKPVRVVLSKRCDGVVLNPEGDRVLEGTITSVSPTDAFCMVAGRHVPLDEVLALHRPHHTQAPASDANAEPAAAGGSLARRQERGAP